MQTMAEGAAQNCDTKLPKAEEPTKDCSLPCCQEVALRGEKRQWDINLVRATPSESSYYWREFLPQQGSGYNLHQNPTLHPDHRHWWKETQWGYLTIPWLEMFTGGMINPETLYGAQFRFRTRKHSLYVNQIGPDVNEKRRLTFHRDINKRQGSWRAWVLAVWLRWVGIHTPPHLSPDIALVVVVWASLSLRKIIERDRNGSMG